MKRSALKPGKPLHRKTPLRSGRPMKASQPKMTKIRASARGEECTLQLPGVCNFRTDTTVLCHDNRLESGKGMGLKAPDTAAAFGCSDCHDVLDGRAKRPSGLSLDELLGLFDSAVQKTQAILRRKNLLK